jgi:hypothetical protein
LFESDEKASISPTVIKGKAKISISDQDNDDNIFMSEEEGKALVLDQPVSDRLYFLIVECKTISCELTVVVHQPHSVITLVDGIPQTLHYEDYNEGSKFLLFNIPPGNNTLMFNVKSKT